MDASVEVVAHSILVVNANASEAATEALRARGPAYAGPGTRLEFATAPAGPEGIDTPLDLTIAAVEVAKVIARERDRHDAFVIACGGDPGLDAARTITGKPVVGIAEAAMLFVRPLGMRFSVLTTLDRDLPGIIAMAQRHGVADRLAGAAVIGGTTAELIADLGEEGLRERAIAACRRAVEEDHADLILLPGSVLAGLEQAISAATGVPAIAGLACGIKLAEALAGLGVRTSRRHRYGPVVKHDRLLGYPELQGVYGLPGAGEGPPSAPGG